jgi:GntR family transcriptional regulator
MEIRLSSTDGLPVYRQIVNQVKYMVASGRLRAGQELPAIRTLAEKLVINPNTVIRAYLELAREGIVESRHGSGTYITGSAEKPSPEAAQKALAPKVDSLLADASHLKVALQDTLNLVRERHRILNQEKS